MATQPRFEGRPVEPGGQPTAGYDYATVGSNAQWGPIAAGAFAGFAAFLILTVLGLAIGVTTGIEMGVTQEVGIGAGIWWLLTLLATGLFGGWVLGRTADPVRSFLPWTHGTVTWVVGALILLVLLTMGVGNILGGVGGAVGQVMAGPGVQAPAVAEPMEVLGLATPVAWILFASLVIGLGATIMGAFWGAPKMVTGTESAEGPQLRR